MEAQWLPSREWLELSHWLQLRRTNRKQGRREAGFTLIELLIVITIIGILAGTVLPQFTGRREQARRSRAIADIENLSTALDMFEVDMGRYPTSEEGLQALFETPSTLEDAAAWQGPYLKRRLTIDPWGNPYNYLSPGESNPASFDLWSFGRDGREGGEGADADVVNWESAVD